MSIYLSRASQRRSVVIGSAPDCDVQIPDLYASPHHCRVYEDPTLPTYVVVEDLGSPDGTFVRRPDESWRRVVVPVRIRPGDTLRVGRTDIPWSKP